MWCVVWHAERLLFVDPKRFCVCIQNVSVCFGSTSACSNTCGCAADTHEDVLNVDREAF